MIKQWLWKANVPAVVESAACVCVLRVVLVFGRVSVVSLSDRQHWQWAGTVRRSPSAGGSGAASGSDSVHQEGAAVALQRLQKRKTALKGVCPVTDKEFPQALVLFVMNRSVPVDWWTRKHSNPSIPSSSLKEVKGGLSDFLSTLQ